MEWSAILNIYYLGNIFSLDGIKYQSFPLNSGSCLHLITYEAGYKKEYIFY